MSSAGLRGTLGAEPVPPPALEPLRAACSRGHNDDLETGSDILPVASHGNEGTAGEIRLCCGIRPDASAAGYDSDRRSGPVILELFSDRRRGGDAEFRRRATSFRVERLLLLPLPKRPAPSCRAQLSGRAGAQILAHPHS